MKLTPAILSCFLILQHLVEASCGMDEKLDFFEKKIRPVLIDSCIECHGEDEQSGKLRLDSKKGWSRGGERGPAIVPGDPASSLLFQAISHPSEKSRMPPQEHADRLTPRQIRDFQKWIREGAVDPRSGQVIREIDIAAKAHWAFQPVRLESIDFGDRNPIDYFIDLHLLEQDLTPTPPADSRTLTRRATYDLTGLPPSKVQYDLGARDFSALIDRLLSSRSYGERWARHWLDVARYSDAKDGVLMYGDARIRPFAYTYRDYVIRAFNNDLPFDEFIRHQIAADMMDLPDNSPHLAAMGLLTLGRLFDRNRHDVIDDQIDVVSRGFLGLTASCSRCHDHKFDPIPTADYYSLYGIFASTVEPLNRPRISQVSENGTAFENEIQKKLSEIKSFQDVHHQKTIDTAKQKTKEYLVHVATTEPDYAETAIFFKSLVPGQLRPNFVHRWRKLIEKRAHSTDPIFAPWSDLRSRHTRWSNSKMDSDSFYQLAENNIQNMARRWQKVGVDTRLIQKLNLADPKTPEQVAMAYGELVESIVNGESLIRNRLQRVNAEITAAKSNYFDLANIVAGGNGFTGGKKGNGIHPGTGKTVSGETGFVAISQHDQLIEVVQNPLVDGVFVPKTNQVTVSSTGLVIDDLPTTSGQTWDYFKNGVSSGSTDTKIGNVDYNQAPNWVLAMHANKGITFDLRAFRKQIPFEKASVKFVLGNSGAQGQSQIDFFVYVDGKRAITIKDFKAQSAGKNVEVPINQSSRFLTLIATEGKQGISHDQVLLGNPRVEFSEKLVARNTGQKLVKLQKEKASLTQQLNLAKPKPNDPFVRLLSSDSSPFSFSMSQIDAYLSRKEKDQYRGLLNQLDTIAVKHPFAADRAMVLNDNSTLVNPVIFQRGDPGQRGNAVPRKFFSLLDKANRPFQNGSGRLELANSIASNENPLTARVWMNRVWMHHFGQPLVENPSDFGLRTAQPRQKRLLDFLAGTFMANGWKTKPIHKLIMLSKTYQRSSRLPPDTLYLNQLIREPENQFYWKANRRRLDLEQMRDSMLFVCGQLDSTLYGRAKLITDRGNHRRTIYAFVERQNLPDIVQTFDAANADSSTARRPNTTVPQQALFAMNSNFVADRVQSLFDSVKDEGRIEKQIEALYSKVLGRQPNERERRFSKTYVEIEGVKRLAHVLLMTNEFMFID